MASVKEAREEEKKATKHDAIVHAAQTQFPQRDMFGLTVTAARQLVVLTVGFSLNKQKRQQQRAVTNR